MYNYNQIPTNFRNQNIDNRFIGGGFLGPFILGGVTGGLVAPLFNNGYGYNRPNYYYNNNYYYPYPPYYGPYYR
ncbi:MAG: hypothetical protein Q4E75_03060 [bacterium]|nr:hypothetical protein [bacterium]